jgi:hypothetical protein
MLVIASAHAASTMAADWYVEETKLSGSSSLEIGEPEGEKIELQTTILGTKFLMTASGATCSGCTASNPGADVSVTFQFTGLKIDAPTGCSVASSVTTNALSGFLMMDPSGGTTTFVLFQPVISGGSWFTFTVSGCALAGSYKVTGTLTCETSPTGTAVVKQPLKCNAASQTTGGGSLKVDTNPATFTGTLKAWLKGTFLGRLFSGH